MNQSTSIVSCVYLSLFYRFHFLVCYLYIIIVYTIISILPFPSCSHRSSWNMAGKFSPQLSGVMRIERYRRLCCADKYWQHFVFHRLSMSSSSTRIRKPLSSVSSPPSSTPSDDDLPELLSAQEQQPLMERNNNAEQSGAAVSSSPASSSVTPISPLRPPRPPLTFFQRTFPSFFPPPRTKCKPDYSCCLKYTLALDTCCLLNTHPRITQRMKQSSPNPTVRNSSTVSVLDDESNAPSPYKHVPSVEYMMGLYTPLSLDDDTLAFVKDCEARHNQGVLSWW